MFPPRAILLILAALIAGQLAGAQTVVNSTFVERPQYPGAYSDPNNWSPNGVPNNADDRQYNVTINPHYFVDVDTNATISNLTLGESLPGFYVDGKNLVVTGTTANQMKFGSINVQSYDDGGAVKFDAGTLSSFSNHVLSGEYFIAGFSHPATLQFNGADITTLANGSLSLLGPFSQVVDEFGNDALRNLARIESTGALKLFGGGVVTNAPFQNDGTLLVNGSTAITFTAAAGLTNFDSSTRTLTGGVFQIIAVELRFNGADIVNLGSSIQLQGSSARVADLAGNDGLRNLAHILPGGKLWLLNQTRTIAGPIRNDGVLSLADYALCSIMALANFDASTRTLSGGTFSISSGAQLRFADADIVENDASITISGAGTIQDLTGADALRNFSDNLPSGEFVIGNSTQFTAPGAFTNAGKIETKPFFYTPRQFLADGRFIVPAGFSYTQTSGTTINDGYLTADHVDIMGGTFSGRGRVKGDLTVQNATIAPTALTVIEGNLTLQPNSHFRYSLDFSEPKEITGKVTLGGTLEIDIPADRFVSSTTLLTVLKSAMPLTGVFSNAPDGARIRTVDGKGSMMVSYGSTSVTLFGYQPEPPPAQLLNISSRAFLSATNDDVFGDRAVVIGGFIITGVDAKEVVVRGLGPSLSQFGLSPVLTDPVLELRASGGSLIASNDNWRQNEAAIQGAGLAPSDDREAALRKVLMPGTYTVVIREKNGQAGHGLVEIYDLTQNPTSKLANISTRGFTDADHLLIGGMIAGGSGPGPADVVVRGLGPELRDFGIPNALDDPTLEIRNSNGVVIGFNDDWSGVYPDPVVVNGLAPSHKADSAMYLSLPPGSYTAIVRPKANSGGVALFEFYDLRR